MFPRFGSRSWLIVAIWCAAGLVSIDARAQFGGLFSAKETVPEVSVEQLQGLKFDQTKPDAPFVLVDVRTEKESSVSLIPGAITKSEYEKNRDRYANRTVIAYCTSGYRSEQYARELISKGVPAKNFKGSILGWCRAELPLVTPEGEPTRRVHTYSSRNRVPGMYEALWD